MMKYQARKKLLLISGSLLIGSVSGHAIATVVAHQNSDKPTINAQQKTPTKWGIFNIECGLSHTLPDDPVIAPFLTEVISRIRPYAVYAASVC
ncbi:hypothetical protein NFB41_03310, partial [Yersinia ruckeri]|nr:hypothetical protein [Yersinia ruckeri]